MFNRRDVFWVAFGTIIYVVFEILGDKICIIS